MLASSLTAILRSLSVPAGRLPSVCLKGGGEITHKDKSFAYFVNCFLNTSDQSF